MERLSIKSLTTGAGVVIAAIGVMAVKAIPFAGGYVAGHAIVQAMQPSVHDQLVTGISRMTLPKRLDESTVLTAASVDGLTVVATNELDALEVADDQRPAFQAALTERVCSDAATLAGRRRRRCFITALVWRNGVKLAEFNVASCPA